MRQALEDKKVPEEQKSVIITMPPPVGGWNARDSLPMMPPTDAVQLTNVVPWPSDVRTRLGSTDWVTGFTSPVQTLMPFNSATPGSKKLFAAAGTAIYDATSSGAVGAAVVSGQTNAQWQYVNFATSAGQFLCAVNGADSYETYNGSTWTATATMPITGGGTLNMNTVIGIAIYQSTLYFIPTNTLGFYYLPAQQITGTVTYFNLAALCKKGGYLVAIDTWTVDGGQGPQDYFVALTSEGEVVVFQGSAFSIAIGSPGYMNMVGVYFIARPIGRRCTWKYGGDLLILTERGIFPISVALAAASIDKRVAITDKIEPAFVANAQSFFSTFGWQLESHTQGQFLLVNVPSSPPTQLIMQFQSKGWANFTGWSANCFLYFNGVMYYGGATTVTQCYLGKSDNGNQINTTILPAFTQLRIIGQQKHVKLVRPYFSADGNFNFAIGAAVDYLVPYAPNAPQSAPTTNSLWDVALWDVGVWGSLDAQSKPWTTVQSFPCVAFTPFFQIATNSSTIKLEAYDIVFARGGVL
jgi:hypothetical protein